MYIYIDQLITMILYYPYIKHIINITFKQSSLINKARKTVLKVLFISGDHYHTIKSRSSMYAIIPIILHICIDQLYFSLCLTFVGNVNHFRGVYLLFYFIITTCIIYYLKL